MNKNSSANVQNVSRRKLANFIIEIRIAVQVKLESG